MNETKTILGSIGLSILVAFLSAWIACGFGFLFSGIDFVVAVGGPIMICIVVTPIVFFFLKRKKKNRPWKWFAGRTMILTLVAVGFFSWLLTSQDMSIQVGPMAGKVHVIKGRSIMFSSYVHFSGQPETIAQIIQSKGLVEIPAEMPEQLPKGNDGQGYLERQKTRDLWDWWRPTKMSNPRFFFLGHQESGYWAEEWWVNGATNEVYAVISG